MQSSLYSKEDITEIYNRNIDMLYRLSFAYLRNKDDVEDAIHDAFVKLLKNKVLFKNVEHEKAWFIVVMTNICKNKLKSFWKNNVELQDTEENFNPSFLQIDETMYSVMKLPNKYKTVVYLYYYEGYTTSQIAKILSKPSSTIRNYLSEARSLLKDVLGGD